jgi:cellulose synthase (UDP-forming)
MFQLLQLSARCIHPKYLNQVLWFQPSPSGPIRPFSSSKLMNPMHNPADAAEGTGSAKTVRTIATPIAPGVKESPETITPLKKLPPHRQLKFAIIRVTVVLAFLFTARYFYWRFLDTRNPAAMWFFIVFLIAEGLNFFEALLFYVTTWNPTRYATPAVLPDRTVDVYIATYNESVELLRETVLCAVNIRYPHETYILDDGARAEVRDLAAEFGCRYIARTDRTHAKAGNLNNALGQTTGEFIVTLDADHVPAPNLIDELIGFFRDERMGAVQTTQEFYNLDSFQHRINWRTRSGWQQQELFFNIIQPGKDRYNAAFYCGSPAMLRRKALEDAGGFATESITEDMHTGMRIQKKKWRVIYHNRSLAFGLAPQTFVGFATQWQRWGHGCMQVLRREHPILGRGLSFGQRLCYFASVYFYWMSYQKLLYILTPIVCLITGVFPLITEPRLFVSFFFPYFFLNLFASVLLQGGFTSYIRSEQFNILKMHVLMKTVAGLFRRKTKFAVTPKSRAGAASAGELILPIFLIIALIVSVVAGGIRLSRAHDDFTFWALCVNIFWSIFYVYMMVGVVWNAMKRKEMRASYRFPARLDLPATARFNDGGNTVELATYARNLNRFGISITLDKPVPPGTQVEMQFEIAERKISAVGEVMRNQPYKIKDAIRHSSGIRFTSIATEDQDEISRYLLLEIAPRESKALRLTYTSQHEEQTV